MSLNTNDRQHYLDEFAASLEQGQRLLQGKSQFGRPIMMKAEGINAHVMLLEDRVRITQKEEKVFLSQGFQPNRDLPLAQIAEVRLKKAGSLNSGFIQFLVKGRPETDNNRRNENMVMFRGACEPQFEKLKAALEARLAAPQHIIPQAPLPTTPPRPARITYIEELEQLASLRNKGVITEEEFAAKKRQILGI